MTREAEHAHDPLVDATVERVERTDGRYLIYYAWPDRDAGDSDTDSEESTGGAVDV